MGQRRTGPPWSEASSSPPAPPDRPGRYRDQSILGRGPDFQEPEGDCFRACVASLLDLPLEDVPHFATFGVEGGWLLECRRWLKERGLTIIFTDEPPPAGCLAIASGPTPRGAEHAVVVRGQELVHDPHPSRAGLSCATSAFYILPLDPLRCRPARS